MESVTWGMQPAIVIEMLQASSRHNQGNAADTNSVRVTKTTAEIVAELKSPKKSLTRFSNNSVFLQNESVFTYPYDRRPYIYSQNKH